MLTTTENKRNQTIFNEKFLHCIVNSHSHSHYTSELPWTFCAKNNNNWKKEKYFADRLMKHRLTAHPNTIASLIYYAETGWFSLFSLQFSIVRHISYGEWKMKYFHVNSTMSLSSSSHTLTAWSVKSGVFPHCPLLAFSREAEVEIICSFDHKIISICGAQTNETLHAFFFWFCCFEIKKKKVVHRTEGWLDDKSDENKRLKNCNTFRHKHFALTDTGESRGNEQNDSWLITCCQIRYRCLFRLFDFVVVDFALKIALCACDRVCVCVARTGVRMNLFLLFFFWLTHFQV